MALGHTKLKALKEGKKKKEREYGFKLEVTVEIRTSGPAPIDDGNRTHSDSTVQILRC